MGLDDRPVRWDPSTGKPAVARTDFADQIADSSSTTTRHKPADDLVIHRRAVKEELENYFDGGVDTYSKAMPEDWISVRYDMKNEWGFSRVSDLNVRTGWAARMYYNNFGQWPKAYELAAYEPYQQSLSTLANGYTQMPALFSVDGQRYYNNPWTGPERVGDLNTTLGPGGIDAALESGEINEFGVLQVKTPNQWSMEQFLAIRDSLSPTRGGGGRGGGGRGGGAGRTPAVFDEDQLAEEATNRWRGLLLEEPNEDALTQLVTDYVAKANAFWMKEGGRTDFDTFVVNRVRAQDRYTFLYDKKPESKSEEEYMGGFRQTVGQFGMNDRATLRETESGAHSGAGLAGFGERVGRTSEVRAASAGSYSQRFAQSMASSGLGRT